MARHSLGLAPSASLVLAAAFWAFGTVIAKHLLASLPPVAFLVLQLAPSVVVLWILVLANGTPRVAWRQMLPIAALGWLNPGLAYTFSMLGLVQTSASVATLLWAAEPALIVTMAWLVLRERVTVRLIGLTATAAGGVLLVSEILDLEASAETGGAVLILGGVLCCALYTVLSRRIVTVVDPLFIVALQQTVGLIWVTGLWLMEGSSVVELRALPLRDLLAGAVSGLMYYVVAFSFYLRGLRSVPAGTAGMFLNLIPVFGVSTAYLFLGERLVAAQWIGAAVILISVCALLGAPSRRPEAAS
ncbi:DMT family transporter [Dongia deserti]|uniref:DMT family transporter n=1 Tax=Dongia deserti TaxID=2268030 RepID=UPI000E64F807|nr:DMT family transporter [Dongia deserti]